MKAVAIQGAAQQIARICGSARTSSTTERERQVLTSIFSILMARRTWLAVVEIPLEPFNVHMCEDTAVKLLARHFVFAVHVDAGDAEWGALS